MHARATQIGTELPHKTGSICLMFTMGDMNYTETYSTVSPSSLARFKSMLDMLLEEQISFTVTHR